MAIKSLRALLLFDGSFSLMFCTMTATGAIRDLVILAVLGVALAGCTAMSNKKAIKTEEVLYKAAFLLLC